MKILSALTLAAALACTLPAFGDEDPYLRRPLVFPCKLGLETRWQEFQDRPHQPEAVHALIQEDRAGQNLIRWDKERYTSIWAGIDRALSANPQAVEGLRKLHEGEARALVGVARQGEDFGKLVEAYRRYPWARPVHEALIEFGERKLRRGHGGLALRCFQDVLTHTDDAKLRARAQVGLWIALAQEEDREALATAFNGIKPNARFPWMGGEASAKEIRKRLLTGDKERTPSPVLTELKPRVLKVPTAPAWVREQPTAAEAGTLIAGPNLLAWYEGESTEPAWKHVFPDRVGNFFWAAAAPGPFVPAVADGRIYTRWGVKEVASAERKRRWLQPMTDIAAFDAHTGASLWSTAKEPQWRDLSPVNDPTLAGGRLYVLAVHRAREFSPVYLVCLDAGSGAILWKRELVSHHTTLGPHDPRKGPRRYNAVDVAHFGNAVTVIGGAVYCLTNVGVVARCDARDGLIEWACPYVQDDGRAAFLTLLRRQGSAPLVTGGRVVFMPRDALGLFALDRDTGELQWRNTDDNSLRCLGIASDGVLVADGRRVVSLDLATGKPRWEKAFDESIDGRTARAGDTLYVGTQKKLYRLDARSGGVKEERARDEGKAPKHFVVHGTTLSGTEPADGNKD